MNTQFLIAAAIALAGCTDAANDDASGASQIQSMDFADTARGARDAGRLQTLVRSTSPFSLPSLHRATISESDLASLSGAQRTQVKEELTQFNIQAINEFVERYKNADARGIRLPDDFSFCLVMAWSYLLPYSHPLRDALMTMTIAQAHATLGGGGRELAGSKDVAYIRLLEGTLRKRNSLSLPGTPMSKEVKQLVEDFKEISDALAWGISIWRSRELATEHMKIFASSLFDQARPIIERSIVLARANHGIPESFIDDLRRFLVKAVNLVSQDLAKPCIEDSANIDQHAVRWGEFTETLATLIRFSNEEFRSAHRKRIIRMTTKALFKQDDLEWVSDVLHVAAYNFNDISAMKRDIPSLIDQWLAERQSLIQLIDTLPDDGLHSARLTYTPGGENGEAGAPITLAETQRRKSYYIAQANYLAEVIGFFGFIETKLEEFRKLALTDRTRKPTAPAPDAGQTPPSGVSSEPTTTPSSTDAKSKPAAETRIASDDDTPSSGDDEPDLTEDDSDSESGEEKSPTLVEVSRETVTSVTSDFYRKTNLVFVPRRQEPAPARSPEARLSGAAQSAWERMKLPGKRVSTDEMLTFFTGLYDLGLIEHVQLIKNTLKVYFTKDTVKAFHHRHHGFDRKTLGEIRDGLSKANIVVEDLY